MNVVIREVFLIKIIYVSRAGRFLLGHFFIESRVDAL